MIGLKFSRPLNYSWNQTAFFAFMPPFIIILAQAHLHFFLQPLEWLRDTACVKAIDYHLSTLWRFKERITGSPV